MENNLALNIEKTKEVIIDFRRKPDVHTPLYINEEMVERVSSFKFMGTHISEELTWTINITALVKKAQKRLYILRMLNDVNLSQQLAEQLFYRCSIESVLKHGMLGWYRSSSAADKRLCTELSRLRRTSQNNSCLPWTTFLPPIPCRIYTIF